MPVYFPCSYYWCKACLRNECISINWNKDEYSHRFYADTLCHIQTHYITCYVGKILSNISSDCKSNLFLLQNIFIHKPRGIEEIWIPYSKHLFWLIWVFLKSFTREIEFYYAVFLVSPLSIFDYLAFAFAQVVFYVLSSI